MRVLAGAVTAICLVFSMSLPAQAHTREELQQFETAFAEKVQVGGMTVELGLEWADMMERHQWYWMPQELAGTSSKDSGSSSSSPKPSEYRGMGSSVEQWRGLVAAFFPAGEVDRTLCIMAHESGGNPSAKNPNSSARGLMQILASLWAPHYGVSYDDLYNPEVNMRIARDIWGNYGWWAWSPYKRGECR